MEKEKNGGRGVKRAGKGFTLSDQRGGYYDCPKSGAWVDLPGRVSGRSQGWGWRHMGETHLLSFGSW